MRYGYLMAAPRRRTKDYKWALAESKVATKVAEERIMYVRVYVLPAVAVVTAAAGYAFAKLTAVPEPAWGFMRAAASCDFSRLGGQLRFSAAA